jgi:hypothetical protein
MNSRRTSSFLFVGCLVIRIIWLLAYPRVIENEGAQYARLAQNLVAHREYMDMRGPVTMISPLYSILIGAASFMTRSPELAGRLISLVAGAAFPVVIFLIAEKIYGRRAALVGGLLAGLHPALIALSAAVYSEGIYMTLIMAALYWTLVATEKEDFRPAVYAGFCSGLAYLARPEGLLVAFLFAAWLVVASLLTHSKARRLGARSGVLLTTSLALAIPFMVFLTVKTGHFYWEGKSPINDNIVWRMENGMTYQEANSGLGLNLSEDGVALNNDQFSYVKTHPVPLRVKWHLITGGLGYRFLSLLKNLLWASFLGSPFLWMLAVVGLPSGPWNRVRLAHEGLLCAVTGLSLFILSSMHFIWDRFLFAVLPVALLWAGHGAVSLQSWVYGLLERKKSEANGYKPMIAWMVPGSLVLLLVWVAARGVRELGEITESRAVEAKAAGLWIASHVDGMKTLMSVGMVVPYYAGAVGRVLPYVDSPTALAYVRQKHPDFLVLRGAEIRQRPYLPIWLQNGIPDPCARLVYQSGDRSEQTILVYEWSCK